MEKIFDLSFGRFLRSPFTYILFISIGINIFQIYHIEEKNKKKEAECFEEKKELKKEIKELQKYIFSIKEDVQILKDSIK